MQVKSAYNGQTLLHLHHGGYSPSLQHRPGPTALHIGYKQDRSLLYCCKEKATPPIIGGAIWAYIYCDTYEHRNSMLIYSRTEYTNWQETSRSPQLQQAPAGAQKSCDTNLFNLCQQAGSQSAQTIRDSILLFPSRISSIRTISSRAILTILHNQTCCSRGVNSVHLKIT